jgi:chemotaxis protein MotA
MSNSPTLQRRGPWQWTSMIAILLGIVLVAAVQVYDGGTLAALLHLPAAIIVFGGTIAATLVSYSPTAVVGALRTTRDTFRGVDENVDELSTYLVALAIRAHRGGLLALEGELTRARDPFLRNGLTLIVDGASTRMLRDALRTERLAVEAREDIPPRVFETAAGYAPTLGILGAVLGLMRVMEHLSAPAALGAGIATAFVATVYGVGFANLVLLPIAVRLRERIADRAHRRDLVMETLFDVQRRINPRLVAHKTSGFVTKVPRVDEVARSLTMSSHVTAGVRQ